MAGWTEHHGGRLAEAGRTGSARRAIEVREKRMRVLPSRQVWLMIRMRYEAALGRPRRR